MEVDASVVSAALGANCVVSACRRALQIRASVSRQFRIRVCRPAPLYRAEARIPICPQQTTLTSGRASTRGSILDATETNQSGENIGTRPK